MMTSIKNIFLSVILIISAINSVKADEVKYETINKPNDLSPFKLSISILNFENIFTPITAGIMAEGSVNNKIFYNGQARLGYIRNIFISKEDLITQQSESKGSYFEGGVEILFADKNKGGKIRVVTESSTYMGVKTERYFLADCEKRVYWAFSGGLIAYTTAKYVNSDSDEYIISKGTNYKAPDGKFLHYNQTSISGFVGLTHRKIKKAVIKANDGYNYRRFYATRFYMHALIGRTAVQDIMINNQTLGIDNATQKPLGYRIGWQWDEMGVVTNFEFGKTPSVILQTPVEKSEISKIFKHNPYLNFAKVTFHFTVFGNDKNYHLKNLK